jgi:hypothetical protein
MTELGDFRNGVTLDLIMVSEVRLGDARGDVLSHSVCRLGLYREMLG